MHGQDMVKDGSRQARYRFPATGDGRWRALRHQIELAKLVPGFKAALHFGQSPLSFGQAYRMDDAPARLFPPRLAVRASHKTPAARKEALSLLAMLEEMGKGPEAHPRADGGLHGGKVAGEGLDYLPTAINLCAANEVRAHQRADSRWIEVRQRLSTLLETRLAQIRLTETCF